MQRTSEQTDFSTRLMKCAMVLDDARAYWSHWRAGAPATAEQAVTEMWFGARKQSRVEVLLSNFRARFDAFAPAMRVLSRWPSMEYQTRALVCHWHLQLADPLYRMFTAELLAERRASGRALHRDEVADWVGQVGPARWSRATHVQFASKLMSCARDAGLLDDARGERSPLWPSLPDEALSYLMYLLRHVETPYRPLDHPYLRSVGLDRWGAGARVGALPDVGVQQMGELTELSFSFPDLVSWAEARLSLEEV